MTGVKRARCPNGERYDKKTHKCLKAKKVSPTKESPKKNITKKVSPKVTPEKLNNTKKASLNKKKSTPRNKMNTPPPIPKLSLLKPEVSDYQYKYFKFVLYQITDGDEERGYIHKDGRRYVPTSFYKLHQIVDMIQEEIENINTKHCTGGPKQDKFCFGIDTGKNIIQQLHIYINYFKHCADSKGRVDKEDFVVLIK